MSPLSDHMTRPQGDERARAERATVAGMAYFALTGPADTTCRLCTHWGRQGKSFRRDEEGYLRPKRCHKFTSLNYGSPGPGVPHETPSCKYFGARTGDAPEIFAEPRNPHAV